MRTGGPGRRAAGAAALLAVSAGLVAWLLSRLDPGDLRRLASALGPREFAVLSGLYLLMAYVRGVRLGWAARDGRRGRLTAIAATHAFLNHILPFRLGELTLPVLLRRFTGHGLASGSLFMVVIRLYDAISIALLSAVSLAVVGDVFEPRVRLAIGLASAAVIGGGFLAFLRLDWVIRAGARAAGAVLARAGASGAAVAIRVGAAADEMVREIRSLDAGRRYLLLPASSVAVTVLNYTLFYLTMVFMGFDIGFFLNMLASLGELVTTFLPNSVGSIGTMEAGWAAGYALCGVRPADAIASGFVMHGVILASGLVYSLFGVGWLLLAARVARRDGGAQGP